MKTIFILLITSIALSASAVENGLYNCLTQNEGRATLWGIEITDEFFKIFHQGPEVIKFKPQGVWRPDTDVSDGWDTRLKVERNSSSIVVTADNVSNDEHDKSSEVVTSTFRQIADSGKYLFSYSDVEFDMDGNVLGTFVGDESVCEKN